ncbi:MAG: amidohydrolase family protein, partial [Candidatus Deferrimicrobiaceae bacterium]
VTPARLIELLSAGPARILGLRGKGTLAAGADADVTIIDPEEEWEFGPEEVLSRSKNSPFLGWKMRGRAAATICGGRVRHSTIAGVAADA